MSEYLVVIEQDESGVSGYVPDLPGCAAAGDTREEVEALLSEAVGLHIEGLKEDGLPVPPPSSRAGVVAA